jgi:cytochrome c-type biogenesis protein CcmH/NrfG
LIWLVLVAVVFVAGGAWLVSKSTVTRGIVLLAGIAAAVGYLLLGHPNMRDEPLAGRLKEIEDQARQSPETMTAAQLMALAQERAVKAPNDPMPHWIMGQILEASDQPNEAALAFEAALRRDPNHLPTIKDLADLRFKLTGDIDPATTMLYHQVFQAEPTNFRVGYMAGIGDWLQGKKAEAEALWASIEANPANDATHRQMFAAMRQMFKIDPPTPEPSKTEGGSPN